MLEITLLADDERVKVEGQEWMFGDEGVGEIALPAEYETVKVG